MKSWWAVVAGAAAVRLVVAALTPLFPDEMYYWEWSRRLAGGYFDHPPVLAWLIRAGTLVFGDTPLGVRFGAVAAGAIASAVLCLAARRIAGERAALITAIVFAVMPLSAAGLVLATPDAPALAAASATLYAIVRVLQVPARSRESLTWWAVAGAALGVAFASKYTAALLPLGVFIALLSRRDLRRRLAEPGPYVATAVALLVFVPVVLWNARHAWISFAFQLQHGFGSAGGSAINRELELLGGQAGLVSPVLFVMMMIAAAASLRRTADGVQRTLAILAFVILAFFAYSATKRRVEANWPAFAYLPGALLLAAHAASRRWDGWFRAGVVVAGVLTLVTYVNAFTPILPVPARRDPAARAAGWSDLARVASQVQSRHAHAGDRVWFAGDRYQEAASLAFHLPAHPETFSLNLSSRANQYDLWPGFPARARAGDGLLLVLDDAAGTPPAVTMLVPHFTTVTREAPVSLSRKGDVVKNLRIWMFLGWRGTWPQAPLRSRS
jgi:4-amino-4-deoxy-L-arabinose transferase-like glycosyltransferase